MHQFGKGCLFQLVPPGNDGSILVAENPPAWSAFRSSDYGFTRFRAHNNTHLYFEQVSSQRNVLTLAIKELFKLYRAGSDLCYDWRTNRTWDHRFNQ